MIAARVLTFGLCFLFWAMASIVTAGWALDPAAAVGNEWVLPVLWCCFAAFLVSGLMSRPLPDPIRDQLWPPETEALFVTCGPELIQVRNERMLISISYRDIQMIRETRHCFYLFPMRNYFLMLRKRDFIQGDSAEFAAFLAGKTGQSL